MVKILTSPYSCPNNEQHTTLIPHLSVTIFAIENVNNRHEYKNNKENAVQIRIWAEYRFLGIRME